MNPMLDEQVEHGLRIAAGAHRPVRSPDDVIDRVTMEASARVRRRHRRMGVAVAAAVAAVVGVAVLLATDGDRSQVDTRPADRDESTSGPGPAEGPGLHAHADAPLDGRIRYAAVWTDTELVIWGGAIDPSNFGGQGSSRAFADGAAFDPQTGQWRILPDSPLPAGPAAAAWTGSEVFVVQDGSQTAAWNPASGEWRNTEPAPQRPDNAPDTEDLVMMGEEVVLPGHLAAWDPGTDRWRPLPDPPLRLNRSSVAWTGDELVVAGTQTPNAIDHIAGPLEAMAYSPSSDTWRVLATADLPAQWAHIVWTGAELIATEYQGGAAVYDRDADTWRPMADLPVPGAGGCPAAPHAVGDVLVVDSCALVVEHDAGWVPYPGPPLDGRSIAGAGALWSIGITGSTDGTLAQTLHQFVPPSGGPRPGTVVKVGLSDLTTPAGFEDWSFTRHEDYGSSTDEPIALQVRAEATAPGGQCEIRSIYYGIDAPAVLDEFRASATETVVLAGPSGRTYEALRIDAGHIVVAESTSDLLEIQCTDPSDAETLGAHLTPPT